MRFKVSAWTLLSGEQAQPAQAVSLLRTGALTVALRSLPDTATVLADARVLLAGQALSAALIAGQDMGIVLRVRGPSGGVLRHVLAGEFYSHSGPAELTFAFIGAGEGHPSGRWRMSLADGAGTLLQPAEIGARALALPPELAAALISALGDCPFVQRAGLRHAAPSQPGPELVARSPGVVPASAFLQTPGGLVPAAALMAGDAVLDVSGRELRLAEMALAEVPAGFGFSPLRLPGPEGQDLILGPETSLSAPEGLIRAGGLPGARPFDGPARIVLMARPQTERPALLAVAGQVVAVTDPEGRLPRSLAALPQSARCAG